MNPASQPYNDGLDRAHPCTAGDHSQSVPGTHEAPVSEVRRPLVRYHGGKWMLAPWIIANLPAHRFYVEPFGGGASVLLRKPRAYAEVYNDLDDEIVNLFRVARSQGQRLAEVLRLTPFARTEFVDAWFPSDDPVEQARRTIVRAFMGFASAAVTMSRAPASAGRGGLARTGFRGKSNRSGTTPAHDWAHYPDALAAIVARLQGVVLENRDAFEVMPQHDGPDTLFYVDPPYVAATRDGGNDYRHEMTDSDHARLAESLKSLRGMVVLSGYPSPLYDELFPGWRRIDRPALADGARPRIECLWLNAAADQAHRQPQQRQLITGGAA
ncbi:DNA adenine methylase [Pseudoxanthomonas sp. LjRoot168]|uniref:DNA adenine methylase n=1 Tax=unclassified Pseudoxanthomonas TaxID=2645906 RepID=UPI003ECDC230